MWVNATEHKVDTLCQSLWVQDIYVQKLHSRPSRHQCDFTISLFGKSQMIIRYMCIPWPWTAADSSRTLSRKNGISQEDDNDVARR